MSALVVPAREFASGLVVGRDAEVGAVSAFLNEPAAGGSALVLDGEAGAGKTTLWLAGVEMARGLGRRVLEARPVEAEAHTSLVRRLGNL